MKCPECDSKAIIPKAGQSRYSYCRMCNFTGLTIKFTEESDVQELCEICDGDELVSYRLDPYQDEINNKQVHLHICESCYQMKSDEI